MERRNVLIGAGGIAAATVGGTALFASSAGASSTGTYEISEDPEVATDDGDVTYVALTEGNTSVTWENFGTDVTHVQTTKTVSFEEGDDVVLEGTDVAGTDIEPADEAGGTGSYELGEFDGITIAEGEDYEGGFAEPPVHKPLDANELDVDDSAEGTSREFTVTVTVIYHLYADEDGTETVDTAEASGEFDLTVTNIEGTAQVGGESTAAAE